jgi:hypothetical protein
MPDHGGEVGGALVAQRLRRSGRVVAAARSTRLRPIHFIHFIGTAVRNRNSNLLQGMCNHYKFVMFGKQNFAEKIAFVSRGLKIFSTKKMQFLNDNNLMLSLWTAF